MGILKSSPSDTLHLLSVLREGSIDPVYDSLEIEPQRVGVLVVLVLCHVTLYVTLIHL